MALTPPDDGVLFVNGRPAGVAPRNRPYLLQEVASDGAVITTRLVLGEPATLAASPVPASAPADAPRGTPVVARPRRRRGGLVALGVAGVVVGTGAAVAVGLQRRTLCTLEDRDGNGYQDCPGGVVAAYATGIGVAAIGGGLVVLGLVGSPASAHGTPTLGLSLPLTPPRRAAPSCATGEPGIRFAAAARRCSPR